MSGKLAATTVKLAQLKLKRTVIYYFFSQDISTFLTNKLHDYNIFGVFLPY